jgi:hypothetical protein
VCHLRAADDRSADHAASPVPASVIGAVEREVSLSASGCRKKAVGLSAATMRSQELAPTAAELTSWLDQAARTLTKIQAASACV